MDMDLWITDMVCDVHLSHFFVNNGDRMIGMIGGPTYIHTSVSPNSDFFTTTGQKL